jgi:PAS domain S-box-containing protein
MGVKNNREAQREKKANVNSTKAPKILTDKQIVELIRFATKEMPIRISIIDKNANILWNRDKSSEVIGYSTSDFNYLSTFDYIHSEDIEKVKKTIQIIIREEKVVPLIYRIFTPEGELRRCLGFFHPYRKNKKKEIDQILQIEINITEKPYELPQELYVDPEKSFHQELVEHFNAPMLFLKNNKINWCNEQTLDLFATNKNTFLDKPFEQLFPSKKSYADYLFQSNNKLLSDGSATVIKSLITKNKKEKEFLFIISALDNNDLSKGSLIQLIDFNQYLPNTVHSQEQSIKSFE